MIYDFLLSMNDPLKKLAVQLLPCKKQRDVILFLNPLSYKLRLYALLNKFGPVHGCSGWHCQNTLQSVSSKVTSRNLLLEMFDQGFNFRDEMEKTTCKFSLTMPFNF